MFKSLSSAIIPSTLRGNVLVDEHQIPRFWATIWAVMSNFDLAHSTQMKKLRHIETLYLHAENLYGYGSLDDALAKLNETALADILESWFVSILNRGLVTDSDEIRWQTGLSFVVSIVTWLSKSTIPNERLRQIEARLHRLSHLYGLLHIRRREQATIIRSLPANVVQGLYEMLDPASKNNPFHRE